MVGAAPDRHFYADLAYAHCLQAPVIDVPEWGAAALARKIPRTDDFDVSGCYPLTPFSGNCDLAAGLERLRRSGAVSVTIVPDPLHTPPDDLLSAVFDVCRPFKTHFIIDRSRAIPRLSNSHRNNVRRALSDCELKIVCLDKHLVEWTGTYQALMANKRVIGPARFNSDYFEALSLLPGLTTFAAFQKDVPVAIALWIRSDDCAYYHLSASRPEGYKARAMFGLVAMAIDHFRDCRIVHLGGAAGDSDSVSDGLAYFKRGFANATRTARLCGAILNRRRYVELAGVGTTFFPGYRTTLDLSDGDEC